MEWEITESFMGFKMLIIAYVIFFTIGILSVKNKR